MPYQPSPAIPPGMDPKAWQAAVDALADETAYLAARLSSGQPLGKGMAARVRSLRATALAMRRIAPQGKDADKAIIAAYATTGMLSPLSNAGGQMRKALPGHALAAADELEKWAASRGFPVVANIDAVQASVARTTVAITHDWERLAVATRDQITSNINRAMVGGLNPREVASRVRGAVTEAGGMTWARGMLIAQTEMGDLYDASRHATMTANPDVFGGWWWRARPDACAICQIKHGMVHEADDAPMRHHRCRCVSVPIVGQPPVKPGEWMPGQRRPEKSILDALPPRTVQRMMDGEFGDLWDWDDWLGVRSNNGWRDSLTIRPPTDKRFPPWKPGLGKPDHPVLPAAPDPLAKWKGVPKPPAPTVPTPPAPVGKVAFDDLLLQAVSRYNALGTGKPLSKSYNYTYFQKFMDTGDLHALDTLIAGKYIPEADRKKWLDAWHASTKVDPALADVYAGQKAAYDKAKAAWDRDFADWKQANGFKGHDFVGMDAAMQHASGWEGNQWANQNWPKTPRGPGYDGIRRYTGSEYTTMNSYLRSEYTTGAPIPEAYARLFDQMDEAFPKAPVDIVVSRGTGWPEFFFPINAADGVANPQSWTQGPKGWGAVIPPPDPTSLVGTVQHQPGYWSTSVGQSGAFGGQVLLRLTVPKGTPMSWADPFSHHRGENEMVLQRGRNFYIHAVYPNPQGSGYVVEAEVLPDGVDPADAVMAGPKPSAAAQASAVPDYVQ